MNIIKKIKTWWKWNSPIFMTRGKLFSILVSSDAEQRRVDDRIMWAVIRPVIFSLEELKKNTWDVKRIEWIQQYLKDNFEVTNENNRRGV